MRLHISVLFIIDQNASDRKPLPYLIQGTKALLSALKSWTQDKDVILIFVTKNLNDSNIRLNMSFMTI